MSFYYIAAPAAIIIVFLTRYTIRRLRAHSIAHLPGPSSDSWLIGNIPEIFRPENIGDADFEWTKTYGNAMRIHGPFGSDVLFISDPKSLQYILNTSGYHFPRTPEHRALATLVVGRGIPWAGGAQHARQRKIMNPAFSYSSLKVFLPLFNRIAQRTVSRWQDVISQSGSTSAVMETHGWMARTTLDVIGQAAFDYSFNAVDEDNLNDNVLAKAYSNLFADAFLNRSDKWLAFESLWGLIPEWLHPLAHKLPARTMQRLSNYMKVARGVAKTIVDRQVKSHATGKEGGKDVMSILVRANLSEDPKKRLSEDEILSQLTTLMLAGHETSASTLSWTLFELSRHPEFQNQVREEIRAMRAQAAQRGSDELTVADLDSMKCLLALMKETLRFHPIIPEITREAGREDIVPLSVPLRTKSGEMVTGIPVSKGQRIIMSVAAYNRLQSVWGKDADTWRPQRFLEGMEGAQKTTFSVFANVATFSGGVRICIGWRFAILEMQAILIELLENFEFSPPPGNVEIIRGAVSLMCPMVKGSTTGKIEMPLTVTPVM